MRPRTPRRKADYVQQDVPEPRVARMWQAIEEARQKRPRARRLRWASFGGVAVLALAWFVFARRGSDGHPRGGLTPAVMAGLVIKTEGNAEQVDLPDGSTLAVHSETRFELVEASPTRVRIALDRGQIECDVSRRPDRLFVVDVRGTEVRVHGTRFAVSATPGEDASLLEIGVRVDRGSVEVRQPGSDGPMTLLGAGDSWSSHPAAAPGQAAPESRDHDGSASPPRPLPSSLGVKTSPPLDGARTLFARADAARGEGHLAEAVRAFEELWRRFPADSRSGMAAFEAGRIRLEALEDPRDAADDFAFAAKHTDGAFREDAEAGRVEAVGRSGDTAACRRARVAFLASYPNSAQAARVRGQCP